jgi:outer membrane protein assembly factor BamE (lipoprotein component of BamABCDE complex)
VRREWPKATTSQDPMKLLTGILLAAGGVLIACAPVIDQRGYLPDPQLENSIKAGADTKTTVQDRLGNASLTATFGGDAWYYVSSTEKQVAFFNPTVLKREILAVYFDKSGKVTSIRHFSLKDGHVISFETRETPARGRELTFLQQLLNAQPGASGAGTLEETNPGGGGGPPTGGGGLP